MQENFTYRPAVSMAGIFFFNSGETTPSFNYMHPNLNLPQPNFFSIPTPFTILSSTKGMVLCRDSNYTYHVCNPFVHTDSSYQCIPNPTRSHQQCHTAVLALNLQNCEEPSFNIICAVRLEKHKRIGKRSGGYYTFDMYSSAIGVWIEGQVSVDLERPIITNSGISNSRGMAFWLTEVPHSVLTYNINENGTDFLNVIEVPTGLSPWARLQLGRIWERGLGLIVSGRDDVRLFHLGDGDVESDDWEDWEELCSLNVGEQVASRPQVLRFEKEVPLWIGSQIVLLEMIRDDAASISTRLHEMPTWVKIPDRIGDSVPYVHACLLPITFPLLYAE